MNIRSGARVLIVFLPIKFQNEGYLSYYLGINNFFRIVQYVKKTILYKKEENFRQMNEKFILLLAKYVKTTLTGGPPRYFFCTYDTAIISDQSAANSTNGISCQILTS